MIIWMKNYAILSLSWLRYTEKKEAIWHGQLRIPLANGKKGGFIHMSEWYKEQIVKMLVAIDNEEYLKKMYIIISNHNEKEA